MKKNIKLIVIITLILITLFISIIYFTTPKRNLKEVNLEKSDLKISIYDDYLINADLSNYSEEGRINQRLYTIKNKDVQIILDYNTYAPDIDPDYSPTGGPIVDPKQMLQLDNKFISFGKLDGKEIFYQSEKDNNYYFVSSKINETYVTPEMPIFAPNLKADFMRISFSVEGDAKDLGKNLQEAKNIILSLRK